MNIELPNEVFFYQEEGRGYAIADNGILRIVEPVVFRKLMFELTYKLRDLNKCYYCGKEISLEERTIDHKQPVCVGGPTITNNMVVACRECNTKKSNMDEQQYEEYCKIVGAKEKKKYAAAITRGIKQNWEDKIYYFPGCKTLNVSTSSIYVQLTLNEGYKNRKYKKVKDFYEKYGIFQSPIILSPRGFLFDGFMNVHYAKQNGILEMPAIVLDNVEVKL